MQIISTLAVLSTELRSWIRKGMSAYFLLNFAAECNKARKNLSIATSLQNQKSLSLHDTGKSIESIKALQLCRRPTSDERRPTVRQPR